MEREDQYKKNIFLFEVNNQDLTENSNTVTGKVTTNGMKHNLQITMENFEIKSNMIQSKKKNRATTYIK